MSNDVLISNEVEKTLEVILPQCKSDVNVISGFCKVQTLKYVDGLVGNNVKKRLLVRFLPSDISSGATDKEIYAYCKQNGWIMYVDHTIHAKTYIFDKIKCIIGSANLTNKGLGISDKSNKEASVCFELNDESYSKILTLYKDSVELTDELYEYIVSHTSDEEVIKHNKYVFKEETIECLFPEDFPSGNEDLIEFYNLRSFKWLVQFLELKDNKTSYFGEITAGIHDAFVKDPRPFRKDIKQHLVDLLYSIKRLNITEIEITRPNHSEVVKLID